MFRSIQIFRLSGVLDNSTIRETFEKKTFKYTKKDRITNEPIPLEVKVTDFKDKYNPKTIHLNFLFQFLFLRRNENNNRDYIIANETFHVIIFPKEQLLIIMGSGLQRNQFQKILRTELESHSGISVQTIKIDKEQMMKIFKSIQKESVRNNIRRPKFYFDRMDDFYKIEESMYSAFTNICASKIKEFEFHKLNASKMDLSLRIVKCTGLVPDELRSHYVLNLVHDGRMSITIDVKPEQWAKFIFEKIYPLLS
jgi:hypothetical protein